MKLSPIDLNLLVALDAVLEEQSLGRAATRLGISKPAMSHAMARLRAQTGDAILVRSGQKWTLTQRAQAVGPRVHLLVAEAFAALGPGALGGNLDREREFRVHTIDAVLSLIGAALGDAIAREAPNAVLRFLPLLDDEAAALRDDVDLAVGVFHDLPDDVRQQRLFRERYVCVVRKGHPKVKGRLRLAEFVALDHVMVAPRGRASGVVDAALRKRHLRRRVVRTVPFFGSAIEIAAETDCIATVPGRFASKHAARYDLAIYEPPVPIPPCVVAQIWHGRVEGDAGHAWLRRTIAQVAHAFDRGTSARAPGGGGARRGVG